jgi:peptidoglycan/LPS O-acetylase OafA/YrhL
MKAVSPSASQSADGRQKLEALTALRFIAASCIVLHHLRGSFGIATNAYASLNLGAAVSFFFVLSGFVLAYAYPRLSGPSEVLAFLIRRWFRVWPLHFACLLILLVLTPPLLIDAAGSRQGWLALLSNIFLLQAWVPLSSYYFSFNPVSWSISVEWFFYLSFPFLLYLMLSRGGVWLALLATFLPLAAILLITALCDVPDYSGERDELTTLGLLHISPVVRLWEFCVGIALQQSMRDRRNPCRFARHIWSLQLLALVLAVWFVAQGRTLSSRPWMPHVVTMWFDCAGGLPIWALLIWSFSYSNVWPAALLSNRIFVALGEVSFAIYLVHFSIGHSAAVRLSRFLNIEHNGLQLAVYCVLVVAASFCLYYAIERPGMAVGKYLANRFHLRRGVSKAAFPAAPGRELSEPHSG